MVSARALAVLGRKPANRKRSRGSPDKVIAAIAAQAILVDREIEILGPVAPFDLDEGDNAAAAGDQVDFADRDAQSLAEDAPAVEAEPPGGTAFGLAPARFGLGAFHPAPLSVSARA